jgi:class 3 adenylate cyclase
MLWLRISGAAVKTASGASVIRAARIMSYADGGEILVSDTVRNLVAGKDYLFSQKGDFNLKGFEEAVRLFEVRWGK